jgi:sugar transferase (PEP-CTERM system associated)
LIRLFNVYYPLRTIILWGGEALLVLGSFLLAVVVQVGFPNSFIVLNYDDGFAKVLAVTGLTLLCLYYFDLYDLQRLRSAGETYVRLLLVIGALAFLLAALSFVFPWLLVAPGAFVLGLTILTLALFSWRAAYSWLTQLPALRERVYILGAGERAKALVEALRNRNDLGMEVVGWAGAIGNGSLTREAVGSHLISLWQQGRLERVIVALSDRRGTMPTADLLQLRLRGVKIDDATALLEKITGKIDVDDLNPSWLIFGQGFRLNTFFLALRRLVSILMALALLALVLPLIPIIILAIRLTSPGPVLYRQKRVGRLGQVFSCYKFRTMRADAEADAGPTWAGDEDPRITRVGRWLRITRFDEIPQLWNVLKGDMAFVGPRPERPEFVEWLNREIPYYQLRHILRPGITGWAQISYKYGSSVEDAKEKLRYDLFYIKNLSLGLDLLIIFQTVKIVLLGRGAK